MQGAGSETSKSSFSAYLAMHPVHVRYGSWNSSVVVRLTST